MVWALNIVGIVMNSFEPKPIILNIPLGIETPTQPGALSKPRPEKGQYAWAKTG
jgi:hypothetical protein